MKRTVKTLMLTADSSGPRSLFREAGIFVRQLQFKYINKNIRTHVLIK